MVGLCGGLHTGERRFEVAESVKKHNRIEITVLESEATVSEARVHEVVLDVVTVTRDRLAQHLKAAGPEFVDDTIYSVEVVVDRHGRGARSLGDGANGKADVDVATSTNGAGVGRQSPGDDLQQRGLADAVDSNDADSIS